MTPSILWLIAAAAWLLLFAGFVTLWQRWSTLRADADLLFATGALDADQASALRGDLARRQAVNRALATENEQLRDALALARDAVTAVNREAGLLGDALDDALGELREIDASELAAFRAGVRCVTLECVG